MNFISVVYKFVPNSHHFLAMLKQTHFLSKKNYMIYIIMLLP